MNKKQKFKKGDIVMILSELIDSYVVQNVFCEKRYNMWASRADEGIYEIELVVINNKVYEANEVTFYSPPIKNLALKIKELENKLEKKNEKKTKWYKKLCFFRPQLNKASY